MIGDKIMYIGVGLQEYYCVCAIIGLLKKKQSLDNSKYEEQKAANRITQMTQKVLSLQDNYSAAATLASLPNMVSTFQTVAHFQKTGAHRHCTADFGTKWSARQW